MMCLTFGLTAFLIGCDASDREVNNNLPQNGVVSKKGTGPAPPGTMNIPEGYPSQGSGTKAADASKEGDKAASKEKAGDKAAKSDVKLSEKEIAGINKLPDAKDRELALAQKVCPISGEHLGGMGAPLKVSADGKTGFLCCEDCKEDFDKDPKAALAKIGK